MNTLKNIFARYKAFRAKRGIVYEFATSIIIAYALVVVMTNYVVYPVHVDGTSMYPTLHNSDYGFSNLITYRSEGVQRFDVVIIYYPPIDEYLIKRIIALPGETIQFKDDVLYINGSPVEEPYLDTLYANQFRATGEPYTGDFGPILVKEGEVFAMGDNRLPGGSTDSRFFGPQKLEHIKSKDIYIFWPLNHFNWITGK
jgi:signal peptidase I